MSIADAVKTVPIALALTFCVPHVASAEVFKCLNAAGKVEYRDTRCGNGIVGTKVPIAPSPTAGEVYAAKQLANQNASALSAAGASTTGNAVPALLGKMIKGMKLRDIQRDDSTRLGDRRK